MEAAIAMMAAVGTDPDLIKSASAAPYLARLEGVKMKWIPYYLEFAGGSGYNMCFGRLLGMKTYYIGDQRRIASRTDVAIAP